MTNNSCVLETNCDSQAKEHKHPIYFRNVYLSTYPSRCVNDLYTWKTTKSMALLHNQECRGDDGLTGNNRSKSAHHKNRPKHRFCDNTKIVISPRHDHAHGKSLKYGLIWDRFIKANGFVMEILRKECSLSHVLQH